MNKINNSHTMKKKFKYDVFISHSTKDKPLARKLAAKLKNRGLRVWFDEWIIKPGDDMFLKIEEGLEESQILILCMTPNAFESDWIDLERSTALFRDPKNEERRFIPVLLQNCEIPDVIRRYKYINAKQLDNATIMNLLNAIPLESVKIIQPSDIIQNIKTQYRNTIKDLSDSKTYITEEIEHKRNVFTKVDDWNKNKPVNLYYLDLDGLDLINSKFDIKIGNKVIEVVCKILENEFGENNSARWGADEFLCCAHEAKQRHAEKKAKLVCKCIQNYPWQSIALDLFVTASIGVACLSSKQYQPTVDWIERAIIGCIYAKREGGNQVKVGPQVGISVLKNSANIDNEIWYLHKRYGSD